MRNLNSREQRKNFTKNNVILSLFVVALSTAITIATVYTLLNIQLPKVNEAFAADKEELSNYEDKKQMIAEAEAKIKAKAEAKAKRQREKERLKRKIKKAEARIDKRPEQISTMTVSARSSQNRMFNLALAASKINGTFLMPGEEFDWFKRVGESNQAAGYKTAPVISGGKHITGYGGGTCQVSTTLYNAINKIGIVPTEINHHSLPVGYVPKGMDATIGFASGKNLVFTNTMEYPIKIEAYAEGGTVTVNILKAKK